MIYVTFVIYDENGVITTVVTEREDSYNLRLEMGERVLLAPSFVNLDNYKVDLNTMTIVSIHTNTPVLTEASHLELL